MNGKKKQFYKGKAVIFSNKSARNFQVHLWSEPSAPAQQNVSDHCLQAHQDYTPEHRAADKKLRYGLYAFQAILEHLLSDEHADYRVLKIPFCDITNKPTHKIDKLLRGHILFI